MDWGAMLGLAELKFLRACCWNWVTNGRSAKVYAWYGCLQWCVGVRLRTYFLVYLQCVSHDQGKAGCTQGHIQMQMHLLVTIGDMLAGMFINAEFAGALW